MPRFSICHIKPITALRKACELCKPPGGPKLFKYNAIIILQALLMDEDLEPGDLGGEKKLALRKTQHPTTAVLSSCGDGEGDSVQHSSCSKVYSREGGVRQVGDRDGMRDGIPSIPQSFTKWDERLSGNIQNY